MLDFRVGIADPVPKAIAYRLLEPALDVAEPVRLICHEGKFQDLLAQLSVHRLDLVIADEPMAKQAQRQGLQPRAGHDGDELLRRAGAEAHAEAATSRNAWMARRC